MHAIVRKIWDDRGHSSGGGKGRIYAGTLRALPAVGEPLTLLVDDGSDAGPPYLVTEPVRRIVGSESALLIDTGASIYRVSIGRPTVGALTGHGSLRRAERRNYRRLAMNAPVRIVRNGGGRLVGLTSNLSAGGLLFRSAQPYDAGERLDLLLRLGKAADLVTELTGQVVRSQEAANDERPELSHATALVFERPWA